VNARINLSNALLQTHDIQGAVREARSVVRIAPDQPDAHVAHVGMQQQIMGGNRGTG